MMISAIRLRLVDSEDKVLSTSRQKINVPNTEAGNALEKANYHCRLDAQAYSVIQDTPIRIRPQKNCLNPLDLSTNSTLNTPHSAPTSNHCKSNLPK